MLHLRNTTHGEVSQTRTRRLPLLLLVVAAAVLLPRVEVKTAALRAAGIQVEPENDPINPLKQTSEPASSGQQLSETESKVEKKTYESPADFTDAIKVLGKKRNIAVSLMEREVSNSNGEVWKIEDVQVDFTQNGGLFISDSSGKQIKMDIIGLGFDASATTPDRTINIQLLTENDGLQKIIISNADGTQRELTETPEGPWIAGALQTKVSE